MAGKAPWAQLITALLAGGCKEIHPPPPIPECEHPADRGPLGEVWGASWCEHQVGRPQGDGESRGRGTWAGVHAEGWDAEEGIGPEKWRLPHR